MLLFHGLTSLLLVGLLLLVLRVHYTPVELPAIVCSLPNRLQGLARIETALANLPKTQAVLAATFMRFVRVSVDEMLVTDQAVKLALTW